MGTVYLASRVGSGFRQQVALKVIRAALPSAEEVRRFHRERQILADLEHPSIARLYDGGTTEQGLPYIVMEYVEGLPIDRYCDQHRLDVDARLELFIRVCATVAYAHRQLVLHLDLKPSNILITAEGDPKLLDFGVARLMTSEPGGEAAARATAAQSRALTPDYASPEMVRNEPLTTASDVYSLGVLLFRLLSGRQPYSTGDLTAAELERRVGQGGRKPPSRVVEESPPGLPPPDRLRRRLHGDLDAIVAKALRPEPELRYTSAEALALDLRRERDHLPVGARGDAFAYRARKFLRRYRPAAATTTLVAAALIAAAAFSGHQARIARSKQLEAERINQIMRKILSAPDSSWYAGGSGHDVTLLEVLEQAGDWLDGEVDDVPQVAASVRSTLGSTYRSLGLFDRAEREIRAARALRLDTLGREHPDSAQSSFDLAVLLRLAGADLAEAESLYREALATCRANRDCQPDLVPAILIELGHFVLSRGELDEGGAHLEEAMTILEARGAGSSRLAAVGWNNVGQLRASQGDVEGAAEAYQRSIDIVAALPDVHEPNLPITLINLADLRERAGRHAEADELLERARAYSLDKLGDNPYIAFLCGLWSTEFAARRGDHEAVLRLAPESLASAEKAAIDPGNLMLWSSHLNYGAALSATGRLESADQQLRRALEILEGQVRKDSWQYGATKSRLGANLVALGAPGDGRKLLREGNEILESALGTDHWRTMNAAKRLADAGF
jgi:serine/threonine-protein kinase